MKKLILLLTIFLAGIPIAPAATLLYGPTGVAPSYITTGNDKAGEVADYLAITTDDFILLAKDETPPIFDINLSVTHDNPLRFVVKAGRNWALYEVFDLPSDAEFVELQKMPFKHEVSHWSLYGIPAALTATPEPSRVLLALTAFGLIIMRRNRWLG